MAARVAVEGMVVVVMFRCLCASIWEASLHFWVETERCAEGLLILCGSLA